MTIDPGSAVITPNQMYAEMQDIGKKVDDAAHAIDRLAAVVDPAMSTLRADITALKTELAAGTVECLSDTKAMGLRITALEHWRWFVLGVAAVGGPIGGLLLARLFGGI